MINILIVCKEIHMLTNISNSVRRAIGTSTCLVTTTTATEALSIIRKRQILFDLFIFDIQLKDQSGYKLEASIRQIPSYLNTTVLFITKESFKATDFSHLATYQSYKKYNYITLPLDNITVQSKVGLYLDAMIKEQEKHNRTGKSVCLNNSKGLGKLKIDDILFLEVQNKTCTFHTRKTQFEINRKSLLKTLDWLDSGSIIRCHRFFAANIDHIERLEKTDRRNWTIYFEDSLLACPASQTYIKELFNLYKARIKNS